MTKISKKTRDEAATICAIVASNRRVGPSDAEWALLGTNDSGDLSPWNIAWAAAESINQSVNPRSGSASARMAFAEAEALLRTGWTP